MEKIQEYFKKKAEEKGIDKENVFKGTVIFGFVAGAYISILWGICYISSPTKYIINYLPWSSAKNAYNKTAHKAKELKYLGKVPEEKRGRFAISFGEMLVLKTALGPVAFPLKLWVTFKILSLT